MTFFLFLYLAAQLGDHAVRTERDKRRNSPYLKTELVYRGQSIFEP
jgi:hypothetical protein